MSKLFNYKIKKIEIVNNIIYLQLTPISGEVFEFKAGQYAMLKLKDKQGVLMGRAFTISSSPNEKDRIEFIIKIKGAFTKQLSKMKINNEIQLTAPHGFFTIDEDVKEIVFLAGGIGVTPFISILKDLVYKKSNIKHTLFFSNKTLKDKKIIKELKNIEAKNKTAKIVITLTQNEDAYWAGETGRINEKLIKKYCNNLKNKYFLLCGPLMFMDELREILELNEVPNKQIDVEQF